MIVNGELVVMNVGSQLPAKNVAITRTGELTYTVHFSSGVHIEMEKALDYLSPVIVSVPKSFVDRTMGLLGYYNGDKTDDLLPPGGLDPLPLNSDLITTHEGFGLFCKYMYMKWQSVRYNN